MEAHRIYVRCRCITVQCFRRHRNPLTHFQIIARQNNEGGYADFRPIQAKIYKRAPSSPGLLDQSSSNFYTIRGIISDVNAHV